MSPIIYLGEHREGRYPTVTISFDVVPMVFVCMSDEGLEGRVPSPNRAVRVATDVGQGRCLVLKWMTTVDAVGWGRIGDAVESGQFLQLLTALNDGVRGRDVLLGHQAAYEIERMIETAGGLEHVDG